MSVVEDDVRRCEEEEDLAKDGDVIVSLYRDESEDSAGLVRSENVSARLACGESSVVE